jgi:hypothetical protein
MPMRALLRTERQLIKIWQKILEEYVMCVMSRRAILGRLAQASCVLVAGFTTIPVMMAQAAPSHLGKACALCGCEANHCDAGVPKHLKCLLQTIDEQLRITRRKEMFNNAKLVALRPTTALCNEVVGMMAELLGFKGFHVSKGTYPYMSANQIADFLGSGGGESDGWRRVTEDEITQHADVGQLVVGVIHGNDMERDHGHTFVVLPGSRLTSTGREMRILQASDNAKIPIEDTLSKAIKAEYLSEVQYYAFMRR